MGRPLTREFLADMLKNPKPGFEEVIKSHFLHRRDAITKTVGNWIAEAEKKGALRYMSQGLRHADAEQRTCGQGCPRARTLRG